jgi:hypothetical protein
LILETSTGIPACLLGALVLVAVASSGVDAPKVADTVFV